MASTVQINIQIDRIRDQGQTEHDIKAAWTQHQVDAAGHHDADAAGDQKFHAQAPRASRPMPASASTVAPTTLR